MTTIEKILQAAERINVHRTPVLTSSTLDSMASTESPVELFFKCELLQKTGCKFEIKTQVKRRRGELNFCFSL
jgi:threonine dehydratase